MNQIGRRIYYDKENGNVILSKEEILGFAEKTSIEKDISDFSALSERNRNTFDVIEFPYGAHAQDFAESNGYRVNVETKELEFSPRDPNNPDAPQEFGPPFTEQIEDLSRGYADSLLQNAIQDATINSLEEEVSSLIFSIANMGVGSNEHV